ncbi:MAG: hypothetical protein AB1428_00160 [Bacteroidota bacterium]
MRSFLLALFLFSCAPLAAQNVSPERPGATPRPGVAAGMGVSYLSARDVVDLVNATAIPGERVAQFRAVAEFFAAVSYPLNDEWIIKAEYAYLAGSYSVPSAFGPADFAITAHLPSVILQYVVAEQGVYNVKLGAGGGYAAGSLTEKYLSLDDRFSGNGGGAVVEIEANTAFGDNLYAYLGANLRWSFVGELVNRASLPPGRGSGGGGTSLNFFGVGARLGVSYFF